MSFVLCKDIKMIILRYTHYCVKCKKKFRTCFWCNCQKCNCDIHFKQTFICAVCTHLLKTDIDNDFALNHPNE